MNQQNPYDNRRTRQNPQQNYPSYPPHYPQNAQNPYGPPPHSPYAPPSQNPYAPQSQQQRRILPTQRVRLDAPPRRRGFFAAILPWKGDSFGEVFRKLIFLIAFSAFCYCAHLLFMEYAQPYLENNKLQNSYRDSYYTEYNSEIGEDSAMRGDLKVKVRQAKFDKLYRQNKDIKGWIKINNTNVDYPVYQSSLEDPEYYLKRTVTGAASAYGTIFMDARVDLDNDFRNIILYGHHMADGSMFANITRFKDLEFYKKTPTITFDSIYDNSEWKIFSILITNTKQEHGDVFYFIRTQFEDDNDYMGFVNQLRVRSILDLPVDVNADDKIIQLSTCSYEFPEFRTVLCARKVRPGESKKVDVSLAKYAENPLYPDVWYQVKGGTKPEIPAYGYNGVYEAEIELDPFANENAGN